MGRLESPCLRFGWGLCLKCATGFPQWCQCKPQPKRKKRPTPTAARKEDGRGEAASA